MYTHNSRKPKRCYHIATPRGTKCKMEHSPYIRWQDTVTETPPPGRRLCTLCAEAEARDEADRSIPWERMEAF